MSETSIAWTRRPRADGSLIPGFTFSPWWGCTKISPACTHCYADAFSTRVGHGKRLPLIWGPHAERRFFSDKHWLEPLKWNRSAARARERRCVFCASMADVFERVAGPVGERMDEARERLWPLIEATPWLDWQLLTKRPENILPMIPAHWRRAMPVNLWLGTTVESAVYIPRIQHLLRTRAAITFVSAEPLLEDISEAVLPYLGMRPLETNDGLWLGGDDPRVPSLGGTRWPALDQIIVGGESGGKARGFDVAWARRLRSVCGILGTSYFCKQLGARPFDSVPPPGLALPSKFASRAAEDPSEWPHDLRVREFPRSAAPLESA
jgi:protein gp37